MYTFTYVSEILTYANILMVSSERIYLRWYEGCRTTRPKTNSAHANSAHIKLGPCQLGPRCKTRPMPTRPNSSFINRQLVPRFRGIEVSVFYHLTARFAPILTRLRIMNFIMVNSADANMPYLARGHAVIVSKSHVQMSINVTDLSILDIIPFYPSKDHLGTSKQCGPS